MRRSCFRRWLVSRMDANRSDSPVIGNSRVEDVAGEAVSSRCIIAVSINALALQSTSLLTIHLALWGLCKTFVMQRRGRTTPVAVLSHVAVVSGLLPLIYAGSALPAQSAQEVVNLPTSKQLLVPAPGGPRRVNSLPISLAVSPDGKWVISLNAGFGTAESDYMQSLSVLNTTTGKVQDFPDARTSLRTTQTFFSGLAFSSDGTRVYASFGSMTNPG